MLKGNIPIDNKFWNDRAKQRNCLTIVQAHKQIYVITLQSDDDTSGKIRFKLIKQFHDRMERNERRI